MRRILAAAMLALCATSARADVDSIARGMAAKAASGASLGLSYDGNTLTAINNIKLGSSGGSGPSVTNGFPYFPSISSLPTNPPTAISGYVPVVWTADRKDFGVYDGAAWRLVNNVGYTAGSTFDNYFLRNGRAGFQQLLTLNPGACAVAGFYSFGACNITGYQAFIGYSETNKLPSVTIGGMSTAGGYFLADNNYDGHLGAPTVGLAAYGTYTEGRATHPNYFTVGVESDCQNTTSNSAGGVVDSVISTPNNIFGAGTGAVCFGYWAYPGGSLNSATRADATSAIGIIGDAAAPGSGNRWKSAIVVGQNAIRPNGSNLEAIKLGTNHEIDWFGATDSAVTRLFGNGASITWEGGPFRPGTDNVRDIGETGRRVANLYVGGGIAVNVNGTAAASTGLVKIFSNTAFSPVFRVTQESGGNGFFDMQAARTGPTDVAANDVLGQIRFQGYASSAYRTGAYINAVVESVAGTTVNTALSFNSAVGTTLRIANSGSLRLPQTNAYINFGATDGSAGYGVRDNAGTVEAKNNAGAWAPVIAVSGAFTGTKTVRAAGGAADCTLIYTNGVLTGGTC